MGGLYLGSATAASPKEIKSRSIKAICQTAGGLESFYIAWGKKLGEMEQNGDVVVHRTGWVDAPDQDILSGLGAAIAFIHLQRQAGNNVLVNCAQGKSRSSSLVIAYLLVHHSSGLTVESALSYVRSKRSIAEPNPGFMKQLEQFRQSLPA